MSLVLPITDPLNAPHDDGRERGMLMSGEDTDIVMAAGDGANTGGDANKNVGSISIAANVQQNAQDDNDCMTDVVVVVNAVDDHQVEAKPENEKTKNISTTGTTGASASHKRRKINSSSENQIPHDSHHQGASASGAAAAGGMDDEEEEEHNHNDLNGGGGGGGNNGSDDLRRVREKRDRNRVHARNTRLRKKALVDELKRTLLQLVQQRDYDQRTSLQSVQRQNEHRQVRIRVLEKFLELRGKNEIHRGTWAAILEEDFTLTLPHASLYNTTTNDENSNSINNNSTSNNMTETDQVLRGISNTMGESNQFATFLQTFGQTTKNDNNNNNTTCAVLEEDEVNQDEKNHPKCSNPVTFQYKANRETFFMDGCTCLLDWEGSSVGAINNQGASGELKFKGSVRGTFNPKSNKLLSVIMTFDSGRIVAQLMKLNNNNNNNNNNDSWLSNDNIMMICDEDFVFPIPSTDTAAEDSS